MPWLADELRRAGNDHASSLVLLLAFGYCGRAFACFDGRSVMAVPDQFIPKMLLDQKGLMYPFRQMSFGKLLERAREGGFGGRPTPHDLACVNSSTRTHSRM